jgi:hypothetical protein
MAEKGQDGRKIPRLDFGAAMEAVGGEAAARGGRRARARRPGAATAKPRRPTRIPGPGPVAGFIRWPSCA